MKNLSKAFAVVLCIMLAVCMLAVTAAAEETTYAAQVGETGYATVAQAVAAANGETVTLLADSAETVTVSGDLYLDLNGYTLAGLTVTDGTLYGMDSSTNNYNCDDGYGKITSLEASYDKSVTIETADNILHYLVVEESDGVSFHRYYGAITHISLNPDGKGVGYKAWFAGDAKVVEQLDTAEAFGYTLQLDGYNAITRWKSAASLDSSKTVSLRVKNYDTANHGETILSASAQLKLKDGTVIRSETHSYNLKEMVEDINADVAAYTTEQINALADWIKTDETMLGWSVANILQEPISYEMNTGADLVVYTELTGNLQSITVKDTDLTLANATLVNGVLTVPAASFRQEYMPSGRLTLIVKTDAEEVQYTGDFTWVIQDWGNTIGGLAYMEKHLVKDGNVYTGALALGADIDLTGKNIQNFAMFKMANTFNGTFDGRNHTITGMKPAATTALFGTLGTNGVVKNLKLTNVQINTYGAGIAYIAKGTIENVYVQGALNADGMSQEHDLGNFGSGLLAGVLENTAKVSNCIVEVTSIADNLRLATAYGRLRTSATADVFNYCNAVGCDGATFMSGEQITEETAEWTKEDFSLFSTNMNFATMDDLWLDDLAKELALSFGLKDPFAPENMKLANPFDMNTGNDLVVENTKLTGTLQSVTIEGTELTLANATLVDGTLTVPAAAFVLDTIPSGNQTLIVKTDSEQIGINGDFVWVINTEAELLAMKNHLTADGAYYDGMLALGADIMSDKGATDSLADGYVVTNKNYNAFAGTDYFVGTFDGRNHVINKILANAATYGIFTNVGPAGVIKNLKITNAYVKTNTAAVVGYRMQGTMENVYVHGQVDADAMSADHNLASFGNGLVAAMIFDEARFNNCIVELATIADGLRLATAYGKLHEAGVESDVFTNCFAVNAADYTFMQYGTWTKQSFTAGGTNATYATMWELWLNDTAKALAQGFGLAEPSKPAVSYTFESFDMNTDADLVVSGTQIPGTVSVMTVKGTELQVGVAVVDGTVTVPAAQFVNRTVPMPTGKLTLVADTDEANYEITGEFIWVIQNAAELADMHKHLTADGTVYTGSLALGADLDMTNTNMANFTMFKLGNTFNGSFDGRMHTISNMTPKANTALFGTLGAKGKVENLKLTGVTISYANAAAVVGDCYGTIENVYVEGSITADQMTQSHNLGNFGCGLLAGRYRGGAKVNSCMVNLTSITEGLRLGTAFGKLQNGATETGVFANCYAIGAAGNTFSHYVGTDYVKADFTTGGSNANFATLEALISSDDVVAIVLASVFGLIAE